MILYPKAHAQSKGAHDSFELSMRQKCIELNFSKKKKISLGHFFLSRCSRNLLKRHYKVDKGLLLSMAHTDFFSVLISLGFRFYGFLNFLSNDSKKNIRCNRNHFTCSFFSVQQQKR